MRTIFTCDELGLFGIIVVEGGRDEALRKEKGKEGFLLVKCGRFWCKLFLGF